MFRFMIVFVIKQPWVGESCLGTLNMFLHQLDMWAGNSYSASIMQYRYVWKIYLPEAERSILNKTGSLMEWRML